MGEMPTSGQPFDIQARLGQLALQMSILWLCGEDLSATSSGFPEDWEKARDDLGEALRDAQRVVGKRVKIGTIWVSSSTATHVPSLHLAVVRTWS